MVFRTALLMTGDACQAEDILHDRLLKSISPSINSRGTRGVLRNACVAQQSRYVLIATEGRLRHCSLEEMCGDGFEPAETGSSYAKFQESDATWQEQ